MFVVRLKKNVSFMFCDHRFFSKCSQLMAVERFFFFFYDLWIIAPSLWAAHVSQCFHFHTHLAHVDVTGGHPNHLLRVMNPTLGTMRWHRVQVVDIRTHGIVINRHTDTQHYRHSTRWRNTWGPPPPAPPWEMTQLWKHAASHTKAQTQCYFL